MTRYGYGQEKRTERISLGAEFVTVTGDNETTRTARILLAVRDDQGEPVHIVLDRRLGPTERTSYIEELDGDNRRTWYSVGCFATELRLLPPPPLDLSALMPEGSELDDPEEPEPCED